MESYELTKTVARLLDNKKAVDIRAVKVRDLTILADYFIIATGTSSTQVKALVDEVEFQLKQMDITPQRVEGYRGGAWILLDYATVVVHIFYGETRDFYDLERLWSDGEQLNLEELLSE